MKNMTQESATKRFLKENMTATELENHLITMNVNPIFRAYLLSVFNYDFNINMAIRDFLDKNIVQPFLATELLAKYRRAHNKWLERLLDLVDLTPRVQGRRHNYQLKKLPFLNYETFYLEDKVHLVVVTKINRETFFSYWGVPVGLQDVRRFEDVYLMSYGQDGWVHVRDQFAQDYREAYKAMQKL